MIVMMRLVMWVLVTMAMVVRQKKVEASSEAMKAITSGFLKVLQECKHELQLPEHIVLDFYHYWKRDYALLNRDMGCAIICMSQKLQLLDETGDLHHERAHDFATEHGADHEVAAQLVRVIHACERQTDEVDRCSRMLEVAKCFRTSMHDLDWAPTMDIAVEELLTEA